MGLCGYNNLIGESIEKFVEGMIESMTSRSETEGKSIGLLVDGEIEELRAIVTTLSDEQEGNLSSIIKGIDDFALAFFLAAKNMMEQGVEFDDACRSIAEQLKKSLMDIDVHHREIRTKSEYLPSELSDWIKQANFQLSSDC